MTDEEYISGFLCKDRRIESEFVDQYYAKTISVCFHFVKNQNDAEDLAQDVFLEVFRSIRSFKFKSKLSTWMYRIAVNKSLNHLNKKRLTNGFNHLNPWSHPAQDFQVIDAFHSTRTDPLNEKEQKIILENSVNSLPSNQRIAFVLHKYDDFSYREIADIMNLSLSAVESLIHRAKNNLRNKLLSFFPEYSKSF